MGLIASLPDIDKNKSSVFVMHEKSEKLIPLHTHQKGQLSYVEGGVAYITIENKTYVVPARHYFWIPKDTAHVVQIGQFATVFRSIYYYSHDDNSHPFYSQMGIYPASELLIQMLEFSECWDGSDVTANDHNFEFLVALKKLLPQNGPALPIILPLTDDRRMNMILEYLELNLAAPIDLKSVSTHFHMSQRSFSRFFQSKLKISFFQYLKTLRMIQAIEMIVKTTMPINEIAGKVGYHSVASFSNAFFDFTNSRPSDLRRK
ncbi:AraC family transcriptional regulator [Dyadobacter luteus]|uniref:AraC family transcriptional regulator n=1 Tax=Dyadobacter luteus TaxID=2259619 RepID=A0A3D8Y3G8_9BACT|nr:AraC family transcriptional regulator [Dyadobacter luteus]REA55519.1 AraC family transcriptional regulator [Dyadobacter luteus]